MSGGIFRGPGGIEIEVQPLRVVERICCGDAEILYQGCILQEDVETAAHAISVRAIEATGKQGQVTVFLIVGFQSEHGLGSAVLQAEYGVVGNALEEFSASAGYVVVFRALAVTPEHQRGLELAAGHEAERRPGHHCPFIIVIHVLPSHGHVQEEFGNHSDIGIHMGRSHIVGQIVAGGLVGSGTVPYIIFDACRQL